MAPAATPAIPCVLSGCHAACPRCGLHNAALCAIACFSRSAPSACNGPGFAPHSRRYANLAPATGAPACAGAPKFALRWLSTAAFQSYKLRPRHVPSRALRAALAQVFRRRAPRPDAGHVPPPARRVCLRRLALRCSFPPRQPRCPSAPRGSLNDKSSDAG